MLNDSAAQTDEPEERDLLRLGVTFGTLRRVGVPHDSVLECLRGMDGLDITDAAAWFHLFHSSLNLNSYFGTYTYYFISLHCG